MQKLIIDPEESSQQVRQLAAVMFTDMTGYTALMQEDEQKAKILSNRQRPNT
jgi:class 3 adenylate cyclase